MIKAYLTLTIAIIWFDAVTDAMLHLSLRPFAYDISGAASAFWALVLPVLLICTMRANVNYVASPQERWQDDENFKQLAQDLEQKYKGRTEILKIKTVLLAFCGYAVIMMMIATLFLLAYLSERVVAKYFQLGDYAYLWYMPAGLASLGALYRLFSLKGGNHGIEITRRQAPKLFMFLKKIRERGHGPAFDKVFIDMELNASVSRHSGILGAFGFGPVVLNLGLPLLQILTVNQLAGVVAHEYGHVAAKDNPLAHWIYRIRDTWLDASDKFNREKIWLLFFGKLHKKFINLFKAYSFTLARFCEYEADTFAARTAGGRNISEALATLSFYSQKLEHYFWNDIWRRARDVPQPIYSPYSKMREYIASFDFNETDLAELLKQQSQQGKTHPELAERLDSLQHNIYEIRDREEDAAIALLGEALDKNLAFLFDKVWRQHAEERWGQIHRNFINAQTALAKFNEKRYSALPLDDLVEIIYAARIVEDDQSIINACREILMRDVDNVFARVNLYGYSLVYEGREENLLSLDELVSENPSTLPFACYFALKHLEERGRLDEAKIYRYRLDDWEYKNRAAEEEREYIYENDVLTYHGMHQEHVRAITNIVGRQGSVAKAWLVRKSIGYFKDTPFFPIILKRRALSFTSKSKIEADIQEALEKQGLAKYCKVFWMDEYKGLKRKIKRLPDSLIYRR